MLAVFGLRRGILYRTAKELGCTKIALGHHREDILETFFLNMFYGGKLKAMPPKLVSDNGEHIVIRPLAYVREKGHCEIRQGARVPNHPLQPLRLTAESAARRVGRMIEDWDKKIPRSRRNHVPQFAECGAVASGGFEAV